MSNLLPSAGELQPFLPEMLLAGAALASLLLPMFLSRKSLLATAVAGAAGFAAVFLAVISTRPAAVGDPGAYFGGLLLMDPFAWGVKLLLIGFAVIVVALWFTDSHDKFIIRGQADTAPEFFALLLIATMGLFLMASTTHMVMIAIAIELASLPNCVLVGFRKSHRKGAAAALKHVLFGAAATAIMLYGMSLIYGLFGTLDLQQVGAMLQGKIWLIRLGGAAGLTLGVGLAGIFVGIGCKIALAPVHFWSPDVFEGAGFDTATFLSVAPVAAGLALLMRILVVLTGPFGAGGGLKWLMVAMLLLGAVTCLWGNLAALRQTNIKRLLACSSMAHAGYMLLGMTALLAPVRSGSSEAMLLVSPAAETLLFYLFMFVFMNGGAFVTAAAIAQRLTGPEEAGMSLGVDRVTPITPRSTLPVGTGDDIEQYAGLSRRAPILAATMLLFLLSLAGFPLTIGFAAKIKLVTTLFASGGIIGTSAIILIAINTVLGAFYYLRVARQMYLAEADVPRLIEIAPVTIVALVLVIPNIAFFVGYGWVEHQSQRHAEILAPAAALDEPGGVPADGI